LKCFSLDELDIVICGVSDSKYFALSEFENLPFELANGFTSKSKCIVMLIEILTTFTQDQQRKFLTFLTGSPRLPIGGITASREFFNNIIETILLVS
jgi:E3 ubiquitin-protein ligase TRIP12